MSKRGKSNGAHGPAMRKALHDSLSRDTVVSMDVEEWSAREQMMHPKRSEGNADLFEDTGKFCRTRALIECEMRFLTTRQTRLL